MFKSPFFNELEFIFWCLYSWIWSYQIQEFNLWIRELNIRIHNVTSHKIRLKHLSSFHLGKVWEPDSKNKDTYLEQEEK